MAASTTRGRLTRDWTRGDLSLAVNAPRVDNPTGARALWNLSRWVIIKYIFFDNFQSRSLRFRPKEEIYRRRWSAAAADVTITRAIHGGLGLVGVAGSCRKRPFRLPPTSLSVAHESRSGFGFWVSRTTLKMCAWRYDIYIYICMASQHLLNVVRFLL